MRTAVTVVNYCSKVFQLKYIISTSSCSFTSLVVLLNVIATIDQSHLKFPTVQLRE